MIYERYHTREIRDLGGLARRTPVLAFFFVLFTLSSIGLPGLNGFAGEFLILIGMFERAWTEAPAGHVLGKPCFGQSTDCASCVAGLLLSVHPSIILRLG